MATSSDGQRFKTKDKPAGERPDVCPVLLNAHAPGVERATPTDQDIKKAQEIVQRFCAAGGTTSEVGLFTLEAVAAQALADVREAAYHAGEMHAIKKLSPLFLVTPTQADQEWAMKWLKDHGHVEPPPSEGKT